LAHGKEIRALVRNREKASSWANQGVELVDGDCNDSAAIEQALKGVAVTGHRRAQGDAGTHSDVQGGRARIVERARAISGGPTLVRRFVRLTADHCLGLGLWDARSLCKAPGPVSKRKNADTAARRRYGMSAGATAEMRK
jgi:hypothetical protein